MVGWHTGLLFQAGAKSPSNCLMSPEPNNTVTAKIFQLQLLAEVRAPTHTGGPIREGRAEAFQKRRIIKNPGIPIEPRFPMNCKTNNRSFRSFGSNFTGFPIDSKVEGRLGRIGPPVWVGAPTSESDCNYAPRTPEAMLRRGQRNKTKVSKL